MIADKYADIARRMGKPTVVAARVPEQIPCRYVWFDSRSAVLSQAGVAVVVEMATHILAKKPAKVIITGHTDLVGDPADNEQLGRYRAMITRSWLSIHKVPLDIMHCVSEGSRCPMVATAQGVSESANRRVEVVLE